MSSSKNFNDKVVLITGSSSGIGHGIAVYLAGLGAQVVVSGRNEDRLNKVAKECDTNSPSGLKAFEVIADLATDDGCHKLVNAVVEQFGRIDVLVNSVGTFKAAPIASVGVMETIDEVMTTNLRNVILIIHLCVPHLSKTKGNIVSISGSGAQRPMPGFISSSMAKAGLNMATRVLGIELGPMGIRINSISPNAVRTPVFDAGCTDTKAMFEAVGKTYPVGRVGEPADIAKAVAFLASEDASFVTGSDLLLDGGSIDVHESYLATKPYYK